MCLCKTLGPGRATKTLTCFVYCHGAVAGHHTATVDVGAERGTPEVTDNDPRVPTPTYSPKTSAKRREQAPGARSISLFFWWVLA